jgi:hypothetical protein
MSRRDFNAACQSAFGEGVEVSDLKHTFMGVTGKQNAAVQAYG